MPPSAYSGDIHCVTTWSKFDMTFTGVSVDDLLDLAKPLDDAAFVLAHSSTGYTTNLPLSDVTGGRASIMFDVDGRPLPQQHGGPGPAAGAAPLLLEVGEVDLAAGGPHDGPGRVLGTERLPRSRRPVAGAALSRRLTGSGR